MAKVKRAHLQAIKNIFNKLTTNEDGTPKLIHVRLAYAISRSESRMEDEMKAIKAILGPYTEYESKRIEICEELSDKGPDGKSVFSEDGKYVGVESHPDWALKINALNEIYKDRIEECNKMLNEEVDIDFYQVDIDILPEEMSKQDIDVLIPFIKE